MINVNEKLNKIFSPKGKKIFLISAFVGVIVIGYFICSFLPPKQKTNENVEQELTTSREQQLLAEMKELDLSDIKQPEDKMIVLSEDTIGRADPFVPGAGVDDADLVLPPTAVAADENSSKIFTTRVSGIMYDNKNPSAILNIEGMDYFVKSGDYLSGYQILSIKKDFITLKSGKNIYRVQVGQLVSGGALLTNYDNNLSNKFGGARR